MAAQALVQQAETNRERIQKLVRQLQTADPFLANSPEILSVLSFVKSPKLVEIKEKPVTKQKTAVVSVEKSSTVDKSASELLDPDKLSYADIAAGRVSPNPFSDDSNATAFEPLEATPPITPTISEPVIVIKESSPAEAEPVQTKTEITVDNAPPRGERQSRSTKKRVPPTKETKKLPPQKITTKPKDRKEIEVLETIVKSSSSLAAPQPRRGRSPSPMWISGESLTYSEVVRGGSLSRPQSRSATPDQFKSIPSKLTKVHHEITPQIVQDNLPTQTKSVSAPVTQTYQTPHDFSRKPPVEQSVPVQTMLPPESIQYNPFNQTVIHSTLNYSADIFQPFIPPQDGVSSFIASGQQLMSSGLGTYLNSTPVYSQAHFISYESTGIPPTSLDYQEEHPVQFSVESQHFVFPQKECSYQTLGEDLAYTHPKAAESAVNPAVELPENENSGVSYATILSQGLSDKKPVDKSTTSPVLPSKTADQAETPSPSHDVIVMESVEDITVTEDNETDSIQNRKSGKRKGKNNKPTSQTQKPEDASLEFIKAESEILTPTDEPASTDKNKNKSKGKTSKPSKSSLENEKNVETEVTTPPAVNPDEILGKVKESPLESENVKPDKKSKKKGKNTNKTEVTKVGDSSKDNESSHLNLENDKSVNSNILTDVETNVVKSSKKKNKNKSKSTPSVESTLEISTHSIKSVTDELISEENSPIAHRTEVIIEVKPCEITKSPPILESSSTGIDTPAGKTSKKKSPKSKNTDKITAEKTDDNKSDDAAIDDKKDTAQQGKSKKKSGKANKSVIESSSVEQITTTTPQIEKAPSKNKKKNANNTKIESSDNADEKNIHCEVLIEESLTLPEIDNALIKEDNEKKQKSKNKKKNNKKNQNTPEITSLESVVDSTEQDDKEKKPEDKNEKETPEITSSESVVAPTVEDDFEKKPKNKNKNKKNKKETPEIISLESVVGSTEQNDNEKKQKNEKETPEITSSESVVAPTGEDDNEKKPKNKNKKNKKGTPEITSLVSVVDSTEQDKEKKSKDKNSENEKETPEIASESAVAPTEDDNEKKPKNKNKNKRNKKETAEITSEGVGASAGEDENEKKPKNTNTNKKDEKETREIITSESVVTLTGEDNNEKKQKNKNKKNEKGTTEITSSESVVDPTREDDDKKAKNKNIKKPLEKEETPEIITTDSVVQSTETDDAKTLKTDSEIPVSKDDNEKKSKKKNKNKPIDAKVGQSQTTSPPNTVIENTASESVEVDNSQTEKEGENIPETTEEEGKKSKKKNKTRDAKKKDDTEASPSEKLIENELKSTKPVVANKDVGNRVIECVEIVEVYEEGKDKSRFGLSVSPQETDKPVQVTVENTLPSTGNEAPDKSSKKKNGKKNAKEEFHSETAEPEETTKNSGNDSIDSSCQIIIQERATDKKTPADKGKKKGKKAPSKQDEVSESTTSEDPPKNIEVPDNESIIKDTKVDSSDKNEATVEEKPSKVEIIKSDEPIGVEVNSSQSTSGSKGKKNKNKNKKDALPEISKDEAILPPVETPLLENSTDIKIDTPLCVKDVTSRDNDAEDGKSKSANTGKNKKSDKAKKDQTPIKPQESAPEQGSPVDSTLIVSDIKLSDKKETSKNNEKSDVKPSQSKSKTDSDIKSGVENTDENRIHSAVMIETPKDEPKIGDSTSKEDSLLTSISDYNTSPSLKTEGTDFIMKEQQSVQLLENNTPKQKNKKSKADKTEGSDFIMKEQQSVQLLENDDPKQKNKKLKADKNGGDKSEVISKAKIKAAPDAGTKESELIAIENKSEVHSETISPSIVSDSNIEIEIEVSQAPSEPDKTEENQTDKKGKSRKRKVNASNSVTSNKTDPSSSPPQPPEKSVTTFPAPEQSQIQIQAKKGITEGKLNTDESKANDMINLEAAICILKEQTASLDVENTPVIINEEIQQSEDKDCKLSKALKEAPIIDVGVKVVDEHPTPVLIESGIKAHDSDLTNVSTDNLKQVDNKNKKSKSKNKQHEPKETPVTQSHEVGVNQTVPKNEDEKLEKIDPAPTVSEAASDANRIEKDHHVKGKSKSKNKSKTKEFVLEPDTIQASQPDQTIEQITIEKTIIETPETQKPVETKGEIVEKIDIAITELAPTENKVVESDDKTTTAQNIEQLQPGNKKSKSENKKKSDELKKEGSNKDNDLNKKEEAPKDSTLGLEQHGIKVDKVISKQASVPDKGRNGNKKSKTNTTEVPVATANENVESFKDKDDVIVETNIVIEENVEVTQDLKDPKLSGKVEELNVEPVATGKGKNRNKKSKSKDKPLVETVEIVPQVEEKSVENKSVPVTNEEIKEKIEEPASAIVDHEVNIIEDSNLDQTPSKTPEKGENKSKKSKSKNKQPAKETVAPPKIQHEEKETNKGLESSLDVNIEIEKSPGKVSESDEKIIKVAQDKAAQENSKQDQNKGNKNENKKGKSKNKIKEPASLTEDLTTKKSETEISDIVTIKPEEDVKVVDKIELSIAPSVLEQNTSKTIESSEQVPSEKSENSDKSGKKKSKKGNKVSNVEVKIDTKSAEVVIDKSNVENKNEEAVEKIKPVSEPTISDVEEKSGKDSVSNLKESSSAEIQQQDKQKSKKSKPEKKNPVPQPESPAIPQATDKLVEEKIQPTKLVTTIEAEEESKSLEQNPPNLIAETTKVVEEISKQNIPESDVKSKDSISKSAEVDTKSKIPEQDKKNNNKKGKGRKREEQPVNGTTTKKDEKHEEEAVTTIAKLSSLANNSVKNQEVPSNEPKPLDISQLDSNLVIENKEKSNLEAKKDAVEISEVIEIKESFVVQESDSSLPKSHGGESNELTVIEESSMSGKNKKKNKGNKNTKPGKEIESENIIKDTPTSIPVEIKSSGTESASERSGKKKNKKRKNEDDIKSESVEPAKSDKEEHIVQKVTTHGPQSLSFMPQWILQQSENSCSKPSAPQPAQQNSNIQSMEEQNVVTGISGSNIVAAKEDKQVEEIPKQSVSNETIKSSPLLSEGLEKYLEAEAAEFGIFGSVKDRPGQKPKPPQSPKPKRKNKSSAQSERSLSSSETSDGSKKELQPMKSEIFVKQQSPEKNEIIKTSSLSVTLAKVVPDDKSLKTKLDSPDLHSSSPSPGSKEASKSVESSKIHLKSGDDFLDILDCPMVIDDEEDASISTAPDVLKPSNSKSESTSTIAISEVESKPVESSKIHLKSGDDFLDILDCPMVIEDEEDGIFSTPKVFKSSNSKSTVAISEVKSKPVESNKIHLESGDDFLDILDCPMVIDDGEDESISAAPEAPKPSNSKSTSTVTISDVKVKPVESSKIHLESGDDFLDILDCPMIIDDEEDESISTPKVSKSSNSKSTVAIPEVKSKPVESSKIHLESGDDFLDILDCPMVIDDEEDESTPTAPKVSEDKISTLTMMHSSKQPITKLGKEKTELCKALESKPASTTDDNPSFYEIQKYDMFEISEAEKRFAKLLESERNAMCPRSHTADLRRIGGETATVSPVPSKSDDEKSTKRLVLHAEHIVEEIPEEKCDDMRLADPDTPKRFVDDDFFSIMTRTCNTTLSPALTIELTPETSPTSEPSTLSWSQVAARERPSQTGDSEPPLPGTSRVEEKVIEEKRPVCIKESDKPPKVDHLPIATIDSEGFIKFVSKREIRKQRSRTSSRNDDDGSKTAGKTGETPLVDNKSDTVRKETSSAGESDVLKPAEENTANLALDTGVWLDKWKYHDAEVKYFESMGKIKKSPPSVIVGASAGNNDDEGGPSGSGPPSPTRGKRSANQEPRGELANGTERLAADLPSGLGGWSDYSTYISDEDPMHLNTTTTPADSNSIHHEDNSHSKEEILIEVKEHEKCASKISENLSNLPSDPETTEMENELTLLKTTIKSLIPGGDVGKLPEGVKEFIDNEKIANETTPPAEGTYKIERDELSPVPEITKDDTIASNLSPIPDEEVLGVSPIPLEVEEPRYEVGVTEVGSQTGRSLAMSPDHKLIAAEVQTDLSQKYPTAVAIQTEQSAQSTIQVFHKTDGNEETIEIATKTNVGTDRLPITEANKDDNVTVEVKYKEKKPTEIGDPEFGSMSELSIVHTDPQAFDTIVVDPDDTSTEVIVDNDGTKRIIVRKVRRAVVSHQQRILTETRSRTNIPAGVDAESSGVKPLAFSEVSLQQQQKVFSEVTPDGTIRHITQGYSGQVTKGPTTSHIKTSEFVSEAPLDATSELTELPMSSSNVRTVVHQVSRKIIRKTRKVIRKITIIDGKEHVVEEVIEEPDDVEMYEDTIPRVSIHISKEGGENVIVQEPGEGGQLPADEGTSSTVEISEIHSEDELDKIVDQPKTPAIESGSPKEAPHTSVPDDSLPVKSDKSKPTADNHKPGKPASSKKQKGKKNAKEPVVHASPHKVVEQFIISEKFSEDRPESPVQVVEVKIIKDKPESPVQVVEEKISKDKPESPVEEIKEKVSKDKPESHVQVVEVKISKDKPESPVEVVEEKISKDKPESPVQVVKEKISKDKPESPVQVVKEKISKDKPESPVQVVEEKISKGKPKSPDQVVKEKISKDKPESPVQVVEEKISKGKPKSPDQVVEEKTSKGKPESPVEVVEKKISKDKPKSPIQVVEKKISKDKPKTPVQVVEEKISEDKTESPDQVVEEILIHNVDQPESPVVGKTSDPSDTSESKSEKSDQRKKRDRKGKKQAKKSPQVEEKPTDIGIIDSVPDSKTIEVNVESVSPIVEVIEVSESTQLNEKPIDIKDSEPVVQHEIFEVNIETATPAKTKKLVSDEVPESSTEVEEIKIEKTSSPPINDVKSTDPKFNDKKKKSKKGKKSPPQKDEIESKDDSGATKSPSPKSKAKSKTTDDLLHSEQSPKQEIDDSTDVEEKSIETEGTLHPGSVDTVINLEKDQLKIETPPLNVELDVKLEKEDTVESDKLPSKSALDPNASFITAESVHSSLLSDGPKKQKQEPLSDQKPVVETAIKKGETEDTQVGDEDLACALIKNVQIITSVKDRSPSKNKVSPKLVSTVKMEKKSLEPTGEMELVKEETYVQLPNTVEVAKIVEAPVKSDSPKSSSSKSSEKKKKGKKSDSPVEDLSAATSIAESIEISVPHSHSSESVKPTENEFEIQSPRTDSTASISIQDPGYEAEDKTTMDELSLAEDSDIGKNKTKKKKKQKMKVNKADKEPSSVEPKSSDFVPTDEPADVPIVAKQKDSKRKGKKQKGKSEDAGPVLNKESVIEEENKSDSFKDLSDKSAESPVKVVEEAVPSRPPSGDLKEFASSAVAISVPVMEIVPTQHELVQTVSPDAEPKAETVESSIQTIREETQEIYSQTITPESEPKPEVLEISIQTSPRETAEGTMQTITPEPEVKETIETLDYTMQTDQPSLGEGEVQTDFVKMVEDVENIESSMQTDTEEKLESVEQTSQTSPEPVKVPIASQIEQNDLIKTEEECSQTSPPPTVATTELSTQTKPSEFFLTSDDSSQTVDVEPLQDKQPAKKNVSFSDLAVSGTKLEEIVPIETSESMSQTTEVPIQSPVKQKKDTTNFTVTTTKIEEISPAPVSDSCMQAFDSDSSKSAKSEKNASGRSPTENGKKSEAPVEKQEEDKAQEPVESQQSPAQKVPSTIEDAKKSKSKRSKFRDKKRLHEDFEIEVQATLSYEPSTETPISPVLSEVTSDFEESKKGKKKKDKPPKDEQIDQDEQFDKRTTDEPSDKDSPSTDSEPVSWKSHTREPTPKLETHTQSVPPKKDRVDAAPREEKQRGKKVDERSPSRDEIKSKAGESAPHLIDPTKSERIQPLVGDDSETSGSVVTSPKKVGFNSPDRSISSLSVNSGSESKPDPSTSKLQVSLTSENEPIEDPNEKLARQWKQTGYTVSKRLQNMRDPLHSTQLVYLTSTDDAQVTPEERAASIKDNIKDIQTASANKDSVTIQETITITVETISTWLEIIEYRIHQNKQSSNHGTNPEESLSDINALQKEVNTLESIIPELKKATDNCSGVCSDDTRNEINAFINTLQEQARAVQSMVEASRSSAVDDLARWEEFLNRVNNISVLVEEQKRELEDLVAKDCPSIEEKLQKLDNFEKLNENHSKKVAELLKCAQALLRDYPAREIPSELYSTHNSTQAIGQTIGNEREKLLQMILLIEEYEQTLKEFLQIVDVAEDIVEAPISVTSLPHLQDEMQKHRKFFVNLSHCKGILESLEGHLDAETRGKHAALHDRLYARASAILDLAAGRSQQMALAASRWTVIEQSMREERGWLQVARQRVPDLATVNSTDYAQYISLYQTLVSDIAAHQAKINQLVSLVHGLQLLVHSPGLESSYEEHLSMLLELQDNVNSSLNRLMAFRESWTAYDLLTSRLENWIQSATQTIAANSTDTSPSMRQFWELKAQFELHNHIRNEASEHFDTSLRIVTVADENLQRQFHTQLQDRWQKLATSIAQMQNTATSSYNVGQEVSLDNKLSLLERELKELATILSDMHGVMKTEEELQLYIERLQVLSSGVARIQDDLGCVGCLLSAAESDRVCRLLGGARTLEAALGDELEAAQVLRDRLQAIRRGLARVRRDQARATCVLDQCEANTRLGHDKVQQAHVNCMGVSDALKEQWQDLMLQRQLLHNLPMRTRVSVSPVHVEREISSLQDAHSRLEQRCRNLLQMLMQRLGLWQRFHTQLERVQQSAHQADYMMQILAVQGSVDYERLVKATERLEDLSASLSEKESEIDDLRGAADPLTADCVPEVAEQIADAVQEAVTVWQETADSLQSVCGRYQQAVRLWAQYRVASAAIAAWADQQASLAPNEALPQLAVCEETLTAQKERLSELRDMVAKIAEDVGVEGSALLQGEVESLARRLEDVKEAITTLAHISEDKEQCTDDLSKTKHFLENLREVSESTLDQSEMQIVQ
ncbi:mucin-17 [Nilaparvata lugens]|uniref:mucin-17 n=1 Tax=Nilaparvata lugens TaxID=108931 RepID=UPI00193C8A1B|nr:mucin-17 [Nilaparvata lugens]